MGKFFGWLLEHTGVGKVVDPVRKFISGKGTYLAASGLIIPAVCTILQKFGDYGLPYLTDDLMHKPEWMALMAGIAFVRTRIAITKAADPTKDPNYDANTKVVSK